jgi:hypothetical protein
MEPEATFVQVISDMVASQRAMTQSLAQMANRLAIVGTPGTQAPHAAQGNSGAGNRPQSPTRTCNFPDPVDQDIYYGSSVLSHRSDTLGGFGCVLSSDLILWEFLDVF